MAIFRQNTRQKVVLKHGLFGSLRICLAGLRKPFIQFATCVLQVALVSIGCNRDFRSDLPNGYSLHRCSAVEAYIRGPDERVVVVAPNIVELGIQDEYVFGVVAIGPEKDSGDDRFVISDLSVPGHFILNTRDGNVVMGLNIEQWRRRLQENGLPRNPCLAPICHWRSSK